MPLRPRQEKFVREYLVDLNATQAAIRAGYSKKTAYSIGEENLKKPEIAKAIAAAQTKRAEKTGRTAVDVLEDIRKVTREASEQGKIREALRGLELEGKHLGMFVDRLSHEGGMAFKIELPFELEVKN